MKLHVPISARSVLAALSASLAWSCGADDATMNGGFDGFPGAAAIGGACDPSYRGPFCDESSGDRGLIGFEYRAPQNPSIADAREYSLAAVNHIRAMTCLPPLSLDSCLNDIADRALAAGSGHGYFIANCMNGEHAYGDACECGWSQENIGMAAGSNRSWTDGIEVPLCGMMDEGFGEGHRGNIESPEWTRLGVGIELMSGGASWFHEFGR